MSAATPKARRHQVKRLAHDAEDAIEGDRRFFKRHPGRSYRIRQASLAEVQTIVECGLPEAPAGSRWFTAVRQIIRGMRMRAYFQGSSDNSTDVREEVARWLFERARPPDRTVERQLEDVAAGLGRGAAQ